MALMKWEPSKGLATLQQEVHHLLESFFDGSSLRIGESMTAPAVEVSDTKDAVVVKAQVPGVSKEQIQVTVSEGMLTIKGETKEEEKKEEKNYLRREFHYGAFTRIVPIPAGVQAEKATAQLKDGMLEVTIPKSEETRVKEIPISV
jgi:HSP20 family protein